ncbi:potassium/sodium hyperpolarization-activated cyclic nucleotide-gated channel 1-like isoform X1 [Anthonomus grandis grandis]|uniref:potassium/sodium hyperpolarization-activated cyclic nucleotide-gated channel 1-like isoform X1 n=1 Tax=Anthonomus grandis grandis TaxID=2921223 RepID=UPI0021661386|nr:potassium/sodium hyperpolarization-activated cyclic nucleotide-gated channel 1-like isoform X1 [Anthonomus grandis grandis]XP_050302726.1 potassium/sodium hyperpolarization-activated cyclic nucleotide-gated channel 1-like isoform X1 [Anthonomus grandis grandis]
MSTELVIQKQDTETHRCTLPGESWNVVSKFIDSGLFVNFRRALKRYTMISKHHPYTRIYAPSLNRLKQEEKLHLIEHYGLIHPLSMFSLYFDIYLCIFLIFHFLTSPAIYALTTNDDQNYIMLPVNVTYAVTMIIMFRTGVYNEKDNTVSLKPRDIAISYIKSYFFLDLSSFLPQILRLIPLWKRIPDQILLIISPFLITSRYIRYFWCLKTFNLIRLYFGFSSFVFKAFRLTITIIMMIVLGVYILYALVLSEEHYKFNRFLKHSEITMKLLMNVGYGRIIVISHRILGPILSSTFLFIGFIFHVTVLVEVNSIWVRFFGVENKQTMVYESISAYTKYKALPVSVRDRIYLYLEFKYHGHFYKESVLTKATAGFLRREILLASTKNYLENVSIFRNIPNHLLRKLRVNLSTEIFLPGDVIIKAGSRGKSMYLIIVGTVSVTSEKDVEICQLTDGSYFGAAALTLNIARIVNVIAVTPCELFKLERSKFRSILKNHPQIYSEIENNIAENVLLALRTDNLDTKAIY